MSVTNVIKSPMQENVSKNNFNIKLKVTAEDLNTNTRDYAEELKNISKIAMKGNYRNADSISELLNLLADIIKEE